MPDTLHLALKDAAATTRLGQALAGIVAPGDVICLDGDLGAGKSHLARALIQRLQMIAHRRAEDVPSPTYTLVQTYEAGDLAILHADLYRLSDPSELDELGLTEAMGQALCLIEWPDRMEDLLPKTALRIGLRSDGDGRAATLRGPGWGARLARIEGAVDA